MNRPQHLLLLLFLMLSISSCEFISNTFEYRDTTEEFMEALIVEDYDKSVELFALEHETAQDINVDTLKAGLQGLRKIVLSNFGENLNYTFMSSNKKFSTVEGESTPSYATNLMVQIDNEEAFGVLKLLFDDRSKKIMSILPLNVKEKIPNMLPFWLFGLLALCIPIFNIYVINQIRKSSLNRKWLKYLAVLFFNVPAISYSAVSGLGLSLLSFQVLLGISFSYMGYLNAIWTFGIPLGGMYWFWKLSNKKAAPQQASEMTTDEILDNFEED